MDRRNNGLRNAIMVGGMLIGVVSALVIRTVLPDSMEAYKGLIFFGWILLVEIVVGVVCAKIFRNR